MLSYRSRFVTVRKLLDTLEGLVTNFGFPAYPPASACTVTYTTFVFVPLVAKTTIMGWLCDCTTLHRKPSWLSKEQIEVPVHALTMQSIPWSFTWDISLPYPNAAENPGCETIMSPCCLAVTSDYGEISISATSSKWKWSCTAVK